MFTAHPSVKFIACTKSQELGLGEGGVGVCGGVMGVGVGIPPAARLKNPVGTAKARRLTGRARSKNNKDKTPTFRS